MDPIDTPGPNAAAPRVPAITAAPRAAITAAPLARPAAPSAAGPAIPGPGSAPIDGERVIEIRKAVEEGRYPVIPTRIADAMIAAGFLPRTME